MVAPSNRYSCDDATICATADSRGLCSAALIAVLFKETHTKVKPVWRLEQLVVQRYLQVRRPLRDLAVG